MSDEYDSDTEKAGAERRLRAAMAAEARAERELREKIRTWFYTGIAVFVALFVAGMLFF